MNKLFYFAAKGGIASIAILFCLGFCVGVLDYMLGAKNESKWLIVSQGLGFLAAATFLVCTLLVWTEGWIFIAENVKSRFWLVSVMLVFALVFFNVFAAYVFHFVSRSRLLTPIVNTTV